MAWYFLGSAYFMLTTKTLTGYDLGWEICAWSYFLSSIHDRCSEETCQSFESRSKHAYYTSRTWDLTDLLMESCNDINLFPGSCLIACVADTLNLLYRLYKWFRRVRGPAATQATASQLTLSVTLVQSMANNRRSLWAVRCTRTLCFFFSVSDKYIVSRKLTGKNYSNLALRAPFVLLCNFKTVKPPTSNTQNAKV